MIYLRGSQILEYSFDGILWDTFLSLRQVYGDQVAISGASYVDMTKPAGVRARPFIKSPDISPKNLEILVQPPSLCQKFKISSRTVLYTAWDSNKLDQEFVKWCNTRIIEIWTPSNIVKEIFEENGIKRPIKVLPHHYKDAFTFGQKPNGGICKFGMGGQWYSHDNNKKNFQKGIDCFIKAFPTQTDVTLSLKLPETGDVEPNTHGDPRIEYIRANWTYPQLAYWYKSLDCFMHLSKFEGFGVMPIESMACGTPVMSTYWSGMKDYLNPGSYYQLDYDIDHQNDEFYQASNWVNPKEETIIDKLYEIYGNRNEARNRGAIASKQIEKFNFNSFKERLVEYVRILHP